MTKRSRSVSAVVRLSTLEDAEELFESNEPAVPTSIGRITPRISTMQFKVGDLPMLDGSDSPRSEQRQTKLAIIQRDLKKLTTSQQSVLRLTMAGWTVAEISQESRIPPRQVSAIKRRAIARLRHFHLVQQHFRSRG